MIYECTKTQTNLALCGAILWEFSPKRLFKGFLFMTGIEKMKPKKANNASEIHRNSLEELPADFVLIYLCIHVRYINYIPFEFINTLLI